MAKFLLPSATDGRLILFLLASGSLSIFFSGYRLGQQRQSTATATAKTEFNNFDGDTRRRDQHGGGGGGSAFCLLVKDDNEILSEWVGYHYHVFRMRRLFLAVDPTSQTDPWEVVKAWTTEGSNGHFDLDVTMWRNDTWAPDYFWRIPRNHSRFPLHENKKLALLRRKSGIPLRTAADIDVLFADDEEQRTAFHKTNLFNIRLQHFHHECQRQVKNEYNDDDHQSNIKWTVLIDSDEYLVPNPWVSSYIYEDTTVNETYLDTTELKLMFPRTPSADSVFNFFNRFVNQSHRVFEQKARIPNPAGLLRGCVMMPRILFGAKEDENHGDVGETKATVGISDDQSLAALTTITWNHTKFESLRWRYHLNFNKGFDLGLLKKPGGYPQKGVIDVRQHEYPAMEGYSMEWLRQNLRDIHHPSKHCRTHSNFVRNKNQYMQPIAVYHYLGSLERYMTRPGDTRREPGIHIAKNGVASYARGDSNHPAVAANKDNDDVKERWWIKGWFDSFVATHGAEATYSVFGDQYMASPPAAAAAAANIATQGSRA